jgi:citrate synthase
MDVKDIFLKEHGKSNNIFIVQIVISGIVLFSILNKIFNNSVYAIVLVILVFIIINTLVKEYKMTNLDKNKKILQKLKELQSLCYKKLDSMYSDANMIVFIHNNIYMYDLNPDEFRIMIEKTNLFLKLKNSSNVKEQKFKERLLIRCTQLKGELLNHFQNFIYTVPKMKEMYTNLEHLLKIYHRLLDSNLDEMYSKYESDSQQVNTQTQYVDNHRKNEWAYPNNIVNKDLYHIDL